MSFSEAVSSAFSQFCCFKGRARRSEYWFFILFNFLITAVLEVLAQAVKPLSFLSLVWELVAFLPGLGLIWRRMHDTGHSGAYSLLVLLPLIGWILVFIKLVTDSQPGTNAYGPDPKLPEGSYSESDAYSSCANQVSSSRSSKSHWAVVGICYALTTVLFCITSGTALLSSFKHFSRSSLFIISNFAAPLLIALGAFLRKNKLVTAGAAVYVLHSVLWFATYAFLFRDLNSSYVLLAIRMILVFAGDLLLLIAFLRKKNGFSFALVSACLILVANMLYVVSVHLYYIGAATWLNMLLEIAGPLCIAFAFRNGQDTASSVYETDASDPWAKTDI